MLAKFLKCFLSAILLALAIARSQAAGAEVRDGFEAPELGRNWSTDRFEPGAVEMQTNVVRAGRRALKITVHARDKFEGGSPASSSSERAELNESKTLRSEEGKDYEFAFS